MTDSETTYRYDPASNRWIPDSDVCRWAVRQCSPVDVLAIPLASVALAPRDDNGEAIGEGW